LLLGGCLGDGVNDDVRDALGICKAQGKGAGVKGTALLQSLALRGGPAVTPECASP
jgi:hypothetical protein